MKQKIYVKVVDPTLVPTIKVQGDWIDLKCPEDVIMEAPYVDETGKVVYDYRLIDLGIRMKLPAGMEGHGLPRSSFFKKKGCICVNSEAIIDQPYHGPNDIWKFAIVSLRRTVIKKYDEILQFRIVPSQKATFWQKLKWFLSNGVEIVPVNDIPGEDRGGIGSTGGM